MQFQNDRHPWNVRTLLESTATPFTIADYGPRGGLLGLVLIILLILWLTGNIGGGLRIR